MKLLNKTLSALMLLGFVSGVQAQSSYQQNNRYNSADANVIVYKDCEFRGESRSIPVGDYINMGAFDFSNDSISSIRVPPGFEVTLYKDDRFRGDFSRVDRDIYCFDKSWNDQVSSLRVASQNSQNDTRNSRNNGNYGNYGTRDGARDREDRADNRDFSNNRGSDYRQNNQRQNNRPGFDNGRSDVTANNVSQVVFANRVLQQTAPNKWQTADSRSGVTQYDEVSRDANGVNLQNNYTAEKVRIDFFTNEVMMVDRNGRRNSFPITSKQAAVANNNSGRPSVAGPNRRIKGECFTYKAYTDGGEGGVRFHGHEGFERFSKNPKTGRICHSGGLVMEINKTAPSTNVTIEIQGKQFQFARNEQEDVLLNTWYRKKVELSVE